LLTDDVRDENLTKTNRYSDVAATSWYNTAVSTLSSMGIITGYPDGTFRPNAAITRAEFAAIAARFDNDGDKTAAKFSDIATHWAKDEISIAYNNGWITGYPDGTFGPQRDITRAETMTLVNRVLNRQPETEDDLLPNMTVWTDNANPKAWYYLAVQEATNSHYYEFKTNSQYEKWTELRETRDWKALEQ
ncbi:MAG: S-layer homology domain-containing protein, partial [Collinsella sp.]|nr:S-layer homology domain-containing protein [Collinsella sp.]